MAQGKLDGLHDANHLWLGEALFRYGGSAAWTGAEHRTNLGVDRVLETSTVQEFTFAVLPAYWLGFQIRYSPALSESPATT